jgi:hypothetical protein
LSNYVQEFGLCTRLAKDPGTYLGNLIKWVLETKQPISRFLIPGKQHSGKENRRGDRRKWQKGEAAIRRKNNFKKTKVKVCFRRKVEQSIVEKLRERRRDENI